MPPISMTEAAMQVTWSAIRLYSASSVRSQTQRGVSSMPSSLLDRLGVGEVVVHRRAVVEAVGVRDDVVVGVVLGFLLEAAVQVAAVDVGAHDLLAVELGDDLDRAVRRRVRRADVDDDVVRVGRVLERAADRRAVLPGLLLHGLAHLRYGTMGCSCSIG